MSAVVLLRVADAWTLLMAKAQRHAESSYGQPAEKRK
jgi:hypothetical protein